MSEDNEKDDSQKTEEATHHKLEEAAKKGQVPLSREINHFFAFIAACIVIGVISPVVGKSIMRELRLFLESAGTIMTDGANLSRVTFSSLWKIFVIALVPIGFFAAAGVAASGVQTKFRVSADQISPKLSRISISSGIKRLFSIKAMVDFVKGLLKLALVGSITLFIIWPEVSKLDALTYIAVGEIFEELREMVTQLFIAVVCALMFLAGLDFLFQKFQFMKEMRMTKQEVKEEHKKLEGSPEVKSARRRKQKELASKRSMQAIPHATVLVTNPTHYAVAIKWDEQSMIAPTVVAKGVDLIAIHMRRIAKEHNVPIIENPPLARALYASLEIDESIKSEHYKAVAEIIRYVTGIDKRYLAREEVAPSQP